MKRRRGISSIYGFIMIFLLSMASLQTWSSAVSSMSAIEGASDQGHQLQEMQSIEHLSLSESGSNLTITNNGEVPSTLEYLRLVGPNDSRSESLDVAVPVGSSTVQTVPPGYAVEVVTSLGNVFNLWPSSDPPGSVWTGTILQGGLDNAQLFQSPYYPSSFFLTAGPSVYAFSSSGTPEWSFDAGIGFVTDVIPLSNGDVFVSAGYGSTSNLADLFELSAGGSLLQTRAVRVLQTAGGGAGSISTPVTKGASSSYALYDGWFYPESGPAMALVSDSFPLAGSDGSNFYFYGVTPVGEDDGVCQPPGNEFGVASYTPSVAYGGVKLNWQDYLYFGSCNRYPQQLIGSIVAGGVIAMLMASPPYSASAVESYPSENPYLAVVSSGGQRLYMGQAPDNGYSAIATNGTDVYLALPQPGQVQVYSLAKGTYSTYSIGIQASQLIFQDDNLFAISKDAVKVFSSSMTLEKTIELAPLSLASFSNTFLQEPALQAPSFLVLNATSYAALLLNASGSASLVLGRYS